MPGDMAMLQLQEPFCEDGGPRWTQFCSEEWQQRYWLRGTGCQAGRTENGDHADDMVMGTL